MNKALFTSLGTLTLALAAGCGTTMPPKELNTAREAYAQAAESETAQLAPAQLEEARQALEAAEYSFDKNKDKPETVDLAYIAWRKVQVAESMADIEQANRQVAETEDQIDDLREDLQERTEARLDATQERLEETKRRAARQKEMSKQQLAAAEAEKKRLEEEKKKTQAELEKERQAREAVEKKLSAALASLEKVAKVKEEKRGVVITLSGAVLFPTGKHELLPIAKNKLDDVAKALKDQGYKKIVVEGHTDSRGTEQNNEKLSQRRADSVRRYLIRKGIEADKITAVGWGEQRPIASNDTPEGRANNRRVELVVTPE